MTAVPAAGLVEGGTEAVQVVTDPYDGTTDQTLTMLDMSGAGPGTAVMLNKTVNQPAAGQATWSATVVYPTPGLWVKQWAGTGTGVVTRRDVVSVAPAPGTTTRSYATAADLAQAMQAGPPVDAERMLRDASLKIDDLLMSTLYDTDTDGYPTDTTIRQALTDATCALVRWWLATGNDGTGAQRAVTSASLAGVSIGYATGQNAPDPYGDEVRGILTRAALLGYGPIVGW